MTAPLGSDVPAPDDRFLRAVVDHGVDAVVLCDEDGVIRWANARAPMLFGCLYVEGVPLRDLVAGEDRPLLAAAVAASRGRDAEAERTTVDLRCASPPTGGAPSYAEAVVIDLTGDPAVGGILVSLHDVTERRRRAEAAARRALHDPLTGLPNRALFTDRVAHALRRLRRHPGAVAVLFADLDRFKEVNDTLGHHVGDAVLRDLAAALRRRLRPGDTVARFGGDEFVMLCESVDPASARAVAERVSRPGLTVPDAGGGAPVELTMSVGAAVTSDPAVGVEGLLAHADAAMYMAKEAGRGRAVLLDAAVPA